MAHRIGKETKQHPGTAAPDNMLGCCLVSFHFLLAILNRSTVNVNINVSPVSAIWADRAVGAAQSRSGCSQIPTAQPALQRRKQRGRHLQLQHTTQLLIYAYQTPLDDVPRKSMVCGSLIYVLLCAGNTALFGLFQSR